MRWLYVSKPLRPPLRDGTTVTVAGLVRALPSRFWLGYFGDPQAPLREAGRVLPADPMGYQPGLWAKARVLGTLLRPDLATLGVHLFFTPNRVTSSVLWGLRRLQPRRPMIQSVMSSAGVERYAAMLRPLDAVVVASDHTRSRLLAAGLASDRVHRIYPGVAEVEEAPPGPAEGRFRVLYAGDLDPVVVDRLLAIAGATKDGSWRLTVACRPKGPAHREQLARLQSALESQIETQRVEILGEVADMPGLLDETALQLYVADHTDRKVDLPLVVLEGMARRVPIIVSGCPPVLELLAAARSHGLSVGASVADADPGAWAHAVADAMEDPGSLLRWGTQARELITREFSLSRAAAAHAALYDAL